MRPPHRLARAVMTLLANREEALAPEEGALVEQLAAALASAREAWPGLRVDDGLWCRYLAARLPAVAALPQALKSLHVDDLYFACACAAGDEEALASFHEHQVPRIDAALRQLRLGQGLLEEVRQQLTARLLVADRGRPPMITSYAGAGRLSSWLRVVAARTGRKALTKERRVVLAEDDRLEEELAGPHRDLDLRGAKVSYRQAFHRAFRRALTTLRPREITLLRQRFIDGLSLPQLGAIYRVHHTTAARWIEKARLELLERTLAGLAEELGISSAECSTIVRLIQSDIDLTLHTLLGEAPAEAPRTGGGPPRRRRS